MPGYRVHLLGGALAGGATLMAATRFNWIVADRPTQACLLAITLAASLFPDVDTPSAGRPWFYGALAVADAALIATRRYFWASLLGFLALFPAIGGHRGWTHSWWAALLVPLPLLLGPMELLGMGWRAALPWYLAAVIGYVSHLLLDGEW